MNTKPILISLLLLMTVGFCLSQENPLPERYKKWIEEEVVYIIAPVEREVFLQLSTDRERDLFIQAFWNHRDPSPGDAMNEFRQEHYRRIAHANRYYGRGVAKPGWRTDRGRIFIMLGEPNDIQRFEGKTQVYPSEVWFYQGLAPKGLPPAFNLVFYQEHAVGEYRLYSPLADGPQALLTSWYGDPIDYLGAFEQLREFAPELSEVSLSLIPGESAVRQGRPSLSSDLLMNRIETTPQREIEDKYARKFLEYKDIVEVEYSVNYIDCDALVKVRKEPSGVYFVHYAIEPEQLSVNATESRYYTTLKLNGTVKDPEGNTIHQFEKDIPLEFDSDELKKASRRPISIRDMFPIIPGEYTFSLLLKNEISKEFTSFERNLFIPGEDAPLQMTSLLLGYSKKENIPAQNRLRPFQAGSYQLYFQANRVFLKQDDLVLAFQIHGLELTLMDTAEVKYLFYRNGELYKEITRGVRDYKDSPNIVETISLSDFPPAHYRVQATLYVEGRQEVFDDEEFDITYMEAIARPWTYSKLLARLDDPVYAFVIGTQLFNKGLYEDALIKLEQAYRARPNEITYALNLARLYLRQKSYNQILQILAPFMESMDVPPYELYFILGRSYQYLGEFSKAITLLDQALSHYGLNTNTLNALAECHIRLGNSAEALAAWEKSLEINAEQPEVQKNVKFLKERK